MGLIKKLSSRKLGVAVGAGVVLTQIPSDISWPIAIVAAAYILGQAIVDARTN